MRPIARVLFAGAFFTGLCVALMPASAAADTPAPATAEYKAVSFGVDEAANTKKLNELAGDGWEYVGPLGNGQVAFKRPVASPQEIAARKEMVRWEGTWEGDAGEKLTFKGERWTSSTPTFGPVSGKVKVVEVREKLTLVDLVTEEGETAGVTVKAILRLDGDTLEYSGTYGETRPEEFRASDGVAYYSLKRKPK